MPPAEGRTNTPVIKRSLYSWVIKNNGRWQILLVCMVVLTVGLRVVPLELQKRIINQAIGMGDNALLVRYSLLFIASVLLASFLKFLINVLQAYIGQMTLRRMRMGLYEHILSLPLSFFRATQPGQVVNALINELASISGFVGSAISVPLINLCTLLAMGGYLFYLSPLLAGLSFVLYPLQIYLVPKLQKQGNVANRYRINISRTISGNIGEVLTGIHEVHGHAGFQVENDKFSQQSESLLQANIRMNLYRYGIKFANNFFENLGPFILFLVGGTMTIKGHFNLGALVAFLSAYSSLSEPWRELMEFYQLLEDSKVRYNNVLGSYDVMPEYLLAPEQRVVYHLHGNIVIRAMHCVTEEGVRLLDDITLAIQPGEMVALVGFSGSGKSSLVQVLAQLMPYSSGSVQIDGQEVRDLSKMDIAENVGIVPQHPFIFSGTVRDNLLYSSVASRRNGSSDGALPDLDRIIEVIQQVGLFVDVLKFGTQAIISEEEQPELVRRILRMRETFQQQFGASLREDIEFFRKDVYLEFGTVTQNIIFGDFLDHRVNYDQAYHHPRFRHFLRSQGLEQPLLAFGATIAEVTLPILQYAVQTPELYADSPISEDEMEEMSQALADWRRKSERTMRGGKVDRLLKLALGFIPGRHKTVNLPDKLRERILQARELFFRFVSEESQSRLQFFDPHQYIGSHSIRDNILFGQPKLHRAGVMERVGQCLLQLLIEEETLETVVDQGLNFQVGGMGEYLSGGQRQKIALARVFLKQPAIYILDEATAALDNASQARTQNFLETLHGRATIMSVVHRLDTIARYDRIVVMKGGKIVENGSYTDLMGSKGVLYGLVSSV